MKDSWQRWALGGLLGLLLGGGGSFLYGRTEVIAAEERLGKEIARLEEELDEVRNNETKSFEVILEMATTLARVEERLKHLDRRLDGIINDQTRR